MQKNRFIVENFEEAIFIMLRKKFDAITLLYADENNNSYIFRKHLLSYLTLYHIDMNAENIIYPEGIELVFQGTDFGLKEIILTKIK